MTSLESANPIRSFSLALQGGLFGVIMAYAALINLDFGGVRIGFSFLPILAIFFWPQKASYSWSLIAVFFVGLFYDIISATPLGMWALISLCLFLILGGGVNPRVNFSIGIGGFSAAVLLGCIFFATFGKLALGYWPSWSSLLANAGVTILMFPLVYWGRKLFTSAAVGKLHGEVN